MAEPVPASRLSQVSHLSHSLCGGTVGQQIPTDAGGQVLDLRVLAHAVLQNRRASSVRTVPAVPSPMVWDSGTLRQAIDPAVIAKIAGIPDDWKAGYARLHVMPCPAAVSPDRWNQIIATGGALLAQWCTQLAGMGWTTADLFGAHPKAPLARYDCAGLVLLLPGCQIIAVTADQVKLRTRTGAIQTFYRSTSNASCRVLLWELFDESRYIPPAPELNKW
jgi:hypothetical protein